MVSIVGGVVGGVILGALALAAVGGVVLLFLWLREPSASADARSHVQSLFTAGGSKRTGEVTGCGERGAFEQGSAGRIWACRVVGGRCVRTFTFVVSPAFGAEPYDRRSDSALTDPCAAPNSAATVSLPGGLKH